MALFKERLYCPVCNLWLGDRTKHELFIAHCEECKATFIWRHNSKKPESQMDKDKPVRCGCGGCTR